MSLISVIFALIAENFITRLSDLRRFDIFYRYVNWLRSKLPHFSFQNGSVALVIVLAGALFSVWLVSAILANILGLLGFLFAIAVLVFSLGPRNLEEDVQNVSNAFTANDYEAANYYASELTSFNVAEPPLQLLQTVKENILLQANTRMLAVFFWFIILGPVGAALFRFSCLLREANISEKDDFAVSTHHLYNILIWLPARICVLSYAIAGNFVNSMGYWNGLSDLWLRESEEFIVVSGIGALRYEYRVEGQAGDADKPDVNDLHKALSLVKRAVIVWVVILALLTVTGWLV